MLSRDGTLPFRILVRSIADVRERFWHRNTNQSLFNPQSMHITDIVFVAMPPSLCNLSQRMYHPEVCPLTGYLAPQIFSNTRMFYAETMEKIQGHLQTVDQWNVACREERREPSGHKINPGRPIYVRDMPNPTAWNPASQTNECELYPDNT